MGGNDAKFDNKRRFGKLSVNDKKGEELQGRERRGGLAMDSYFCQRDVL